MLTEDLCPVVGEQSSYDQFQCLKQNEVSNSKEFVYTLLAKSFAIDTQPKYGFIRHQESGTVFGQVVYNRLLTPFECRKYRLRPDTGLKQLIGNIYQIQSEDTGQSYTLCVRYYDANTGIFELVTNTKTHLYTTWKHVIEKLSSSQWKLQSNTNNFKFL